MRDDRFTALGEVADFINGYPFKPEQWNGRGTRIIRIQNLTDTTKPFNKTDHPVPQKYVVRKNDVLVSWSATLGVFRWPYDEEGLLNQHIFKVVPNTSKAHPDYLAYAIETAIDSMLRFTHGSTMRHINRGEFLKTQIYLPPLPEQRRIAAVLDAADALRAKRRAALGKLDALLQSVFLEMFGDPVRNERGWERYPFSDVYWFQEGPGVRRWQFTSEGVKLLNVGNIEAGGILNLAKTERYLSIEEAFGRYKHFLVDPGDFVVASSGVSFDDDGFLRTRGAFVSEHDLPLCMNTSTIRFKAIEGLSTLYYLYAWLDSYEFRSQITKAVTGSAQQNFGPSHLKRLSITLPPFALQKEFIHRIKKIEKITFTQRQSLRKFEALFVSLQQRAFRGEL